MIRHETDAATETIRHWHLRATVRAIERFVEREMHAKLWPWVPRYGVGWQYWNPTEPGQDPALRMTVNAEMTVPARDWLKDRLAYYKERKLKHRYGDYVHFSVGDWPPSWQKESET